MFSLSQVKANGLIVFVPKYGIEGPVYLTTKQPGPSTSSSGTKAEEAAFVLDEKKQTVVSRCVPCKRGCSLQHSDDVRCTRVVTWFVVLIEEQST